MSTDDSQPQPVENSTLGYELDDEMIEHFAEDLPDEDMAPTEEVIAAQRRKNVSREFFLYSFMGSLVGLAVVLLVVERLVEIPQKWEWVTGALAVVLCLMAVWGIYSAIQSNIKTMHVPLTLLLFGITFLLCLQSIVGLVSHLKLEGLKEASVETCIEKTPGVLGQSRNGAQWTVTLLNGSDIQEHRLDRQSDGTWSFAGEALPGCA